MPTIHITVSDPLKPGAVAEFRNEAGRLLGTMPMYEPTQDELSEGARRLAADIDDHILAKYLTP
jgi:hypothetical protein